MHRKNKKVSPVQIVSPGLRVFLIKINSSCEFSSDSNKYILLQFMAESVSFNLSCFRRMGIDTFPVIFKQTTFYEKDNH